MSDQIFTTAAELSAIVPQVWSSKYYENLLAELPFADSISKEYAGEIANLGDTVNIFSVPEFSDATELAEGAKGDADSVTVAPQQLVINKRTYKDFIITSKAQLQALPMMDRLRDAAIYAIRKRMERIIIAAIVPSAANPDHTLSYTGGTTLALADILAAKELLDAQNVPMSDRHAVLGTAQLNDIFNIPGFISSDFGVSGNPLASGELKTSLLGFQPHVTTEVGNVSYFFHRSFMTMAVQQGINVSIYDLGSEGKRAARVNVDTLWGLKQLDNKRVVTIS